MRREALRGICAFLTIKALSLLCLFLVPLTSAGAASPSEFKVGNHYITRVFARQDDQAYTVSFTAATRVDVTSKEFELICGSGAREVIVNRFNSILENVNVAASGFQAVLNWIANDQSLEVEVHYHADENYPYIFKWLKVTNRSNKLLRIKRATVEALEVQRGDEPWRGGIGQPVLLLNEFFFGIEHPAAANDAHGQDIVLSHYPETDLAPGATWKSARSVLGATIGADQSVEDAFGQYLKDRTSRGPVYRPIYIDWAAHDELGTLVKPQLSEGLTNGLLDLLQSMKSREGIQFKYYVLDAFWYAPTGAYITFKKPNWPDGFGSVLKRILALGMKPGLWFDISCAPHSGQLHDQFIDLKDTPGWNGPVKPCLTDPKFAQFLDRAIAFQIQKHSLSMLKFDFANMLCRHDDAESPSLALLEKNADALRAICKRARIINPAMVIRAYNGFSSSQMMGSTKYYDQAYSISPWWLLWFDSVYSGDPRPADLPSYTSLRDSIIWYQDHVVRGYMRSLMPPFTIDDSGTLVGKTSTIYYIGAQGFTDSWIMNIMRGNLAPELYGDVRLLKEKDRRFMAATLNLLQSHQDVIAKTRPILGVPGLGQVYGYLSEGNDLAFVTIVNPGLYSQSFQVPSPHGLPTVSFEKLLFSNDGERHEYTRPLSGVVDGVLVPGEIRVYALGPQELVSPLSLPPAPTRKYHLVAPFADLFTGNRNASMEITQSEVGKTLAFVIQYRKNGQPDRSFVRPEDVLKIAGSVGLKSVKFSSIPAQGTDIWSGCSWTVFKHRVAPEEINQTLSLALVGSPPAGTQLKIQGLWLK